MYRAMFASALAAMAVLTTAALCVAHGALGPYIVVPIDYVLPGQEFPVIAADFGSDANVRFEVVAAGRAIELGSATAGPDGHFETNFQLPSEVQFGQAELVANSDDGTQASIPLQVGPLDTSVLPGQRPEAWQDPSVLLLAAGLAGGALLLGWTALRASRRERVTVAKPATAGGRATRRKARRG